MTGLKTGDFDPLFSVAELDEVLTLSVQQRRMIRELVIRNGTIRPACKTWATSFSPINNRGKKLIGLWYHMPSGSTGLHLEEQQFAIRQITPN